MKTGAGLLGSALIIGGLLFKSEQIENWGKCQIGKQLVFKTRLMNSFGQAYIKEQKLKSQ